MLKQSSNTVITDAEDEIKDTSEYYGRDLSLYHKSNLNLQTCKYLCFPSVI